MTRQEMKANAKASIKGHIWMLLLIFIIAAAIEGVCSIIPVVGSLASFFVVTPAITFGLLIIYFHVANNEAFEIAELFEAFKGAKFWSMFKVIFFSGLYTMLWSCLLVVPGIIKAFSYSMAQFIIAENPTMGANDAITLSRKMMDGHKWEYFVFILSFIGWCLLACLTFGLLYIWLLPYMQTAQINFYKNVKAAYEGKAEAPVAE